MAMICGQKINFLSYVAWQLAMICGQKTDSLSCVAQTMICGHYVLLLFITILTCKPILYLHLAKSKINAHYFLISEL